VRVSIASPLMQPSPNGRRVGIRIVTFGACSGFTRVTARRIAQPPKATFVARLQPDQLPDQTARQLPDLSTSIRVRSSLTDGSRLRGALPFPEASLHTLPASINEKHHPEEGVVSTRPCVDDRRSIWAHWEPEFPHRVATRRVLLHRSNDFCRDISARIDHRPVAPALWESSWQAAWT
jgi:hypothetical protein